MSVAAQSGECVGKGQMWARALSWASEPVGRHFLSCSSKFQAMMLRAKATCSFQNQQCSRCERQFDHADAERSGWMCLRAGL